MLYPRTGRAHALAVDTVRRAYKARLRGGTNAYGVELTPTGWN